MGRKKSCPKRKRDHSEVSEDFHKMLEDDREVTELINDYFNRKFSYSSEKLSLDDNILSTETVWCIEKLQQIKANLNHAKNQLSTLDINTWRTHTQSTHKGSEIVPHLKSYIKPELCTQAWCKFHEILCNNPQLVPLESESFNSFHLCEAPGAFITSLNHYLTSREYQGNWKWKANTLNPLYEGNDFASMIDTDDFIRETLDHWCFGFDNTGDITVLENIEHMKKICRQDFEQGVHLVTCDGSIDCANDPGEQESRVFDLQFCEVVASLSVLKEGGSMVLKMFTMFECPSVCLMYLISNVFEQVNVIKPVTSKPGNSELYVVATEFRGISCRMLDKLKCEIKTGRFKQNLQLFPLSVINELFLRNHIECCEMFSTWQRTTILANLESFQQNERVDKLENIKSYFVFHYMQQYDIKHVHKSKHIVTRKVLPTGLRSFVAHHGSRGRHRGSLLERKAVLSQSVSERLAAMEMFDIDGLEDALSFDTNHLDLGLEWPIVTGKLFDSVCSSKFCNTPLLSQYLYCLKNNLSTVVTEDYNVSRGNFLDEILLKIIKMHKIKAVYSTNKSLLDRLQHVLVDSSSETEILKSENSAYECHLRLECVIPSSAHDMESIVLKQHQLAEILGLILSMRKSCSLLMPLGSFLTRISAQIFCIFQACFQKVSVFRDGQFPHLHLFAHSFLDIGEELRDRLENLKNSVLLNTDKEYGVLSFLPLPLYYDLDTLEALHNINDGFMKMRINFFLESLQNVDTTTRTIPTRM